MRTAYTPTPRMLLAARLYGDGYSFSEIGAELGISKSGAKHLVTEARRRLDIPVGNAGRRELRERLAES